MTLVKYYPRYARNEARSKAASWTPSVDVVEHEDSFDLTLDLPGIKKEDLTITVKEGKLYLSGEKKRPEHDTNDKFYHYYERPYGTFERTFSLPEHVDGDKIKATFADGELHVVVPKLEKARPRTIKVS
jgi:HSP20 family protein